MNIVDQIQEGMMLWKKTVGIVPSTCYLGQDEAEQWDRECNKPDLVIGIKVFGDASTRNHLEITSVDIDIRRVTDRSYMGFGV